jgi:hypothetical protein
VISPMKMPAWSRILRALLLVVAAAKHGGP